MALLTIPEVDRRIEDVEALSTEFWKSHSDKSKITDAEAVTAAKWNQEIAELKIRREVLGDLPANRVPFAKGGRSDARGTTWQDGGSGEDDLGRLITNSDEFKTFDRTPGGAVKSVDVEIKTVLTTTGISPQARREDGLLPMAQRPLRVAELFAQGETDQSAVVYMEETTFTNAAAETAEGEAKPEATLVFTERTEPVRKIAVTLPVTDEALDDVKGLEEYLRDRLPFMVQLREDAQLLNGDGTAPNLSGILDRAIQTYAKGTIGGGGESTPDAIYHAATKIYTSTFLEPDGVVIHPNDFEQVRLLRTADGIYIFGDPATSGANSIFGWRLVVTPLIAEGTSLVGAFRLGAKVVRRQFLNVAMSSEHDDFFKYNKVLFRAEERLALVCYRPEAFCSVTGV